MTSEGRRASAPAPRARVAAAVAATALAACSASPATAGAATWTPVRDATAAGQAFSPSVAADAGGRFSIAFARQLRGSQRAEVRRGLLSAGLRGSSLVLDSSADELSSISITQSSRGLLGAAWLRHADRAQGPRAATVSADGEIAGPVNLVPAGTESASDPRWVLRPDGKPLLVWDRRTSSAYAPLDGRTFGAPVALPGAGSASQVSVVEDQSGARVAVWTDGTRILGAQAPADGPFGARTVLSGPGTARDPQLALSADGTVLAGWVRNMGAGNVMEVAARAPGGAFGTPVAVSGAGEGAFSPRLVASSAGEVVAVWVSATTARGWGGARGPLRLRRLTGRGAIAGAAMTLTPTGVRTADPALADDGAGAVFIGWSSGLLAARQIGVRRLGRHGRLGAVRTLAAGRWEATGAPVIAAAAGRAVLAWSANGIVRYRLYG
jgi:hypothetical protein